MYEFRDGFAALVAMWMLPLTLNRGPTKCGVTSVWNRSKVAVESLYRKIDPTISNRSGNNSLIQVETAY